MKVYIVMRNWSNGFEGHDVIESVYSTEGAAEHEAAVQTEYNTNCDVEFSVEEWDVQ